MVAYKRVLLKLSGEALSGKEGHGIDPEVVGAICDKVKEIVDMGVQVSIVVGGGNFWKDYGIREQRQRLQLVRIVGIEILLAEIMPS